MNKLIVVTSHRSVGCTFLDWSILYLSGLHQHYFVKQQCMVPVPSSPFRDVHGVFNAHNHSKNHPSGLSQTLETLADLQRNGASIQTVYPCPLVLDQCYKILGVDLEHIKHHDHARAIDVWITDYQNLLTACQDQQLPLIYIDADPAVIGYHWHIRALGHMLFSDRIVQNPQERRTEVDNLYYDQNQQQWQPSGSLNVWDERERIALNLRPFDIAWFPKFGLDRPYMHINCRDFWNLTPDIVRQCFDFLDLRICESRWESWLTLARSWQEKQHRLLCFFHSLDHIIEATLNGWYYPLPRLELWQEAVIQHCLIYKHGYNLKTWQLERFPDNTQKLYALLEPNIHNIPKIY